MGLSMVVPEAKESASWYVKKALDIAQGALLMCGAWGFLLAFHWQFYEAVFPSVGEESDFAVFAAVIFAVAATDLADLRSCLPLCGRGVGLRSLRSRNLCGRRDGSGRSTKLSSPLWERSRTSQSSQP